MSNVRRLRGTNFSIDYDYPKEIQEARSRLWPQYKSLKQDEPRSKVQIVYPAKLIHNGALIRDGLPEWNRYVGANRLSKLNQIETVKTQYIRQSLNTSDTLDHIQPMNEETIPMKTFNQPDGASGLSSINLSYNMSEETIPMKVVEPANPTISMLNPPTFIPPRNICTNEQISLSQTPVVESTSSAELQSRGRSRATKAAARSEKRSQSSVPYRRQSVSRSKSRVSSDRVLPNAKNSNKSSECVLSQPINSSVVTVGVQQAEPSLNIDESCDSQCTGRPPTVTNQCDSECIM
ncbi:hypothetical protein ACF0H5_000278 [Mactra antiquata]